MAKYRIVTNGRYYKVQKKVFYCFIYWEWVSIIDDSDFIYDTLDEAISEMSRLKEEDLINKKNEWRPV